MDKTHDDRLADALGEYLIALAGEDREAVKKASQAAAWCESVAANDGTHRPGLFAVIYAAEMLWSARRDRGFLELDYAAHAAALVAAETIIENELAALHRAGDLAQGVAAALATDAGKAVA